MRPLSSTARAPAGQRGVAVRRGARALLLVVLSCAASLAHGISDIVFPTPLPPAQIGQPYSFTFVPVNVQGFLIWSIGPLGTSCLPASSGLRLDSKSGVLSGTPTAATVYQCTIVATDTTGAFPSFTMVTKDFTLVVGNGSPPTPPACVAPTITSGAFPSGIVGVPYAFTVTASGDPPLTLSLSGLPQGLAFDPASGAVSGAPTGAGTSTLRITASNGCEPAAAQTQSLTVIRSASVLSMSASPDPAYFGQAVIVVVRAAGGPSAPQGVVMLCARETTAFCPAPFDTVPPGTPASAIRAPLSAPLDASGEATFTLSGLSIDNYLLEANYGGDAAHDAASAGPIDEFVIKGILLAPPRVALVAPQRAASGSPLSIGVRVTPSTPGPTPTGTARLYAGADLVGSATLDASGSTQFRIASAATGTLALRADYSGDALFPPAVSPQSTIIIAADAAVEVPAVGSIGLALLALALAVLATRRLFQRTRRL
jgi:Bacterial Ig-like domain (group 3)/Putative Ig domain